MESDNNIEDEIISKEDIIEDCIEKLRKLEAT
jgi:hypothetical protein